MAEIPKDTLTSEELDTWYKMATELKKLRASEILLRKAIFTKVFPAPREGTNNYKLADDYVLKGTYSLERNVDEALLDAQLKVMRAAGINTDDLFVYKPRLAKGEYNTLTAEQQHLVDQVLVIKPGSPSLEITKPKSKK